MAIRLVTLEPKPSPRNPGYHYFYFNKKTDKGSECGALLHPALVGLVHKGFIFDDAALRYDEDLRSSVLELDFAEAPADPAQPADPETGWNDPDHLTAIFPTPATMPTEIPEQQQQQRTAAQVIAAAPDRGVRPATLRKREARASNEGIPLKLAQALDITARSYTYLATRIGVVEKPRAMEAKSLVITNLIPFFKEDWLTTMTEDQLKEIISSIERA